MKELIGQKCFEVAVEQSVEDKIIDAYADRTKKKVFVVLAKSIADVASKLENRSDIEKVERIVEVFCDRIFVIETSTTSPTRGRGSRSYGITA